MASSYAEAAQRLRKQIDERQQALSQPGVAPEQQAEAYKLSQTTGVGINTVRRNLDDVKKAHPAAPIKPAPVTEKLVQDPELAPAVKDDVHNLNWWERQVDGVSQSFGVGQRVVELSDIGYQQLWNDDLDKSVLSRGEELDKLNEGVKDYDFGYFGGVPSAVSEQLPIWAKMVTGSAEEVAVGGALGFAGTMGNPAGAVAGAGWGFKVGSSFEAFKMESGLAYREYLGEGYDRDASKGAAVAVGMVNAGLEAFGLGMLLRRVPGADVLTDAMTREGMKRMMKIPTARQALVDFGKTVAEGAVVEGGTEGLQELMTVLGGILAGKVSEGEFAVPEMAEVTARVIDAAIKGSQGGMGFSAATGTANYAMDMHKVRAAGKRASLFTEMGKAAQDSRTRERLPEKYQQFLQDAQDRYGQVTDVYVNADTLEVLFQQGDYSDNMPKTAARLEEAIATGEDVAIPLDEFAAWIAPSDIYADLVPDLKFAPDELTLREAQEKQAEYDDLMGRMDAVETANDPIYEDMKKQLEAAGRSPLVADQYAQVWSAFFNTQALSEGKDAWEMYKSFNTSVRASDLRGQRKAGLDRTNKLLDMLREGRGPTQRDIYGETFGEAIAKAGGIKDSGGKLKARDFDRRVKDAGGSTYFANRRIMQDNGMSFDDAIMFGIENGYFPETAWGADGYTFQDVLDALDNELDGSPVYSSAVDNEAMTLREELDYLEETIRNLGLDLEKFTNGQIQSLMEGGTFYQERDGKIYAYHGSPHDFDKFSMENIGTGEGAQAYGPGLYFAEAEDVARGYRDALTGDLEAPDIVDTDWGGGRHTKTNEGWQDEYGEILDAESADAVALDAVMTNPDDPESVIQRLIDEGVDGADEALSIVGDSSLSVSRPGRMYQVEIDASPDELLDWDLPLSDQSVLVKNALKEMGSLADPSMPIGSSIERAQDSQMFAGDFVGLDRANESVMRQRLTSHGIKGIKYKDGFSRGGEGGTSNYVIFDDRLISIAKKYGVAIPVAAAMLARQTGQNPDEMYKQDPVAPPV